MDIKRVKYYIGRYALRATLVVLLIIIFLMIKPASTGFELQKEFKEIEKTPEAILSELATLRSSLSASEKREVTCVASQEKIQEQFLGCEELRIGLNQELSIADQQCSFDKQTMQQQCSNDKSVLQRNISAYEDKIDQLQDEIKRAENSNDEVIQNAANNICCKRKVDDSTVTSYSIIDEKIVCLSNGQTAISC